jgi:uncharacterized protein (TIGR02466 family)
VSEQTAAPAARRLIHLFTSPILEQQWPDTAAMDDALRRLILERRSTARGVRYSNVGGWHSEPDFEAWSGDVGKKLTGMVIDQVNRATQDYLRTMRASQRRIVWRITLWANVNEAGDYNRSHTHPGATWSGVYYVDAGDEPPETSETGTLVLHHPNLAAAGWFFPDVTPQAHYVRPRAGLMLLFPAYLAHEVRPYTGQRPRISVAFNAKIEPDATAPIPR